MISIQHLTKRFGDFTAVNDVSFDVKPGEVLGFLGPNGAGKSTTMKMLTGFLAIDEGRISVMGLDIATQATEAQKLIGYLPEGAPAYHEMKVASFLKFIAQARGLKGEQAKQAVNQAVNKLELQKVLNKRIETLSKGFVRRVGLAQAILHDPQVLVLDEPTDGLDPNQKHQVRELIRNLSKDKIVIVSTHLLEEVSAVCTRALILASGRIVFNGTPEELASRSKYHNAIRVRFKRWDDAYAEQLQKLEGLDSLDTSELTENKGVDRVTLFPEPGVNLLQSVNALIQQQGWQIEEISLESGRLDDVFRDITRGEAA